MGEAGRQTVQQRFDWPVVARLHHQLYAELAERRCAGQEAPAWRLSTLCGVILFVILPRLLLPALGPKLSCAWRCHWLSYKIGSIISRAWIAATGSSMPAQKDVQRLLVQLQSEGSLSLFIASCLAHWPVEQHDALRLRSHGWRNWALFIGLTPGSAMTQAENPYRQDVFLEDLRQQKDRQQSAYLG